MSDSDSGSTSGAGKWISRLAITATIIAVFGGGFILWDHHDYPVKGFGDPRDPFAHSMWPEPVAKLGDDLWQVRQKLYNQKLRRIHRRRLANVKFENTEWYFSVNGNTPYGTITFLEGGALQISGTEILDAQSWFSSDRYERTRDEKLVIFSSTEDRLYEFTIDFSINHNACLYWWESPTVRYAIYLFPIDPP